MSLPAAARVHESGFEYDLEALDSHSRVELAEIGEGRFAIASDAPHVRVAWRATPYRPPATERQTATEEET